MAHYLFTVQAQNRLEQTNSIAITEKSAAEAGIKYNNLSNSIKAVNDQLDLARAKGKNAYESLNSAGIQGLTLSIKELRDNIKQAKAEASLFKSAENTAMRAAAPGICATKVAFAASRLA